MAEDTTEAETISNIIGTNDENGQYTGMKALLSAQTQFDVKPRIFGTVGVCAATVGEVAASSVLRPGYDFALANPIPYAMPGLDKNSVDFQSLRTQARSIGYNIIVSANDAAQT